MTIALLADAVARIPVFEPASPHTASIRNLFVIVLILAAVIFTSVATLIVIAMIRFRERPGTTAEQVFGNKRIEIAWTVGPAFVVFWLAVVAAKLVLAMNAIPEHVSAQPASDSTGASNAADIVVTGHQWWWEVRYPASGVVTANELHIPFGKKLRVRLESADVVHSFWAPQVAHIMDAVPGKSNWIWLEANRAGTFDGACVEFCGNQHAWMRFEVVAQEPADFQKWLDWQRKPAARPEGALARRGHDIFFSQTCANCHAISGTDAKADAAPDLTHVASRRFLAGGAIANSSANLARWLKDPASIKPGCKMPNFNFDDQQIEALVAYLGQLE